MSEPRTLHPAPAAMAVAVVGLAVAHVVVDDDQLAVELVEASILLVFALVLVFVAVRVAREGFDRESVGRVVTAGLVSGAVVGALAAVYLWARSAAGEPVVEGWFTISIGWTLGTCAGALVGYVLEGIREERHYQEQLNGRLTVLQRVLRHNIRNEVSIISGVAQLARESTEEEEVARRLLTLEDHANRVAGLSENAQTLANVWSDQDVTEMDLVPVVRAKVARLREQEPSIDIAVHLPTAAGASVHPMVEYAIWEALDNTAAHNDPEALSVEVTVSTQDQWTIVEVVDDGSAVPKDEITALEESHELPLRHGSGLGLWIVNAIVDQSGGRLDIENRDPAGVCVRMAFPTCAVDRLETPR
ncbi:sensor histidine kinase [Halobaculum limi]|uniref:sensor histidine kinase n=1 Tax=Halobaculum limi TaxID=3031916 RepID=UPI00240541DD|nr:HAMP domain-containing sensor histidine kinase [Halobaculum sp. YSMS11]